MAVFAIVCLWFYPDLLMQSKNLYKLSLTGKLDTASAVQEVWSGHVVL